uniref:Uncharacterized protein AlNc14C38G3328 n=1 Tax=Albugo laibachii Nc14 TaxID=890382 RepID=F0W961_9STRA|nr:hypothetical protein PITG_02637 [Albugo laibachii Nc14]|eukprot:CCA17674.1 hypothetical protein PITG_02637 [Albugo laibachii Nc14]
MRSFGVKKENKVAICVISIIFKQNNDQSTAVFGLKFMIGYEASFTTNKRISRLKMVDAFAKSLEDTQQIELEHANAQDNRSEERRYNCNTNYALRLTSSDDEESVADPRFDTMRRTLFNAMESQDMAQYDKTEDRSNISATEFPIENLIESETGTLSADENETLSNVSSTQTAINSYNDKCDSDTHDQDSCEIDRSFSGSLSKRSTKALRKREKGVTLHRDQDQLDAFDFEKSHTSEHEEPDTEDRKKKLDAIAIKTLEFQFGLESQQSCDSQVSSILNISGEVERMFVSDSNEGIKPYHAKFCSPQRVEGDRSHDKSTVTKQNFLSPDAGIPAPHSRSRKRLRKYKVSHDLISASSVIQTNNKSDDIIQSTGCTTSTTTKTLDPTPLYRIHLLVSKKLFQFRVAFCLSGFSASAVSQLSALIKAYGGAVYDEEILQRPDITNVILLATPNAWRKLKFMYAVARGIPVVHTEWLHTCIKTNSIVDCLAFRLPSGYSRLTRKYECLPVQNLPLFAGLTIGCPFDVEKEKLASTKELAHVMKSIARSCGANKVIEGLGFPATQPVDIILSEEYTDTCSQYFAHFRVPIKDFAWISECVIQQRLVDPTNEDFDVQRSGESVQSIIAEIVNSNTLKLHIGEMIRVDLDTQRCESAEHFSLYNICEILELRRQGAKNQREQVVIKVRVLERGNDVMSLTRENAQDRWIKSNHIQKRVVVVSEGDFKSLHYRDENLYFFSDFTHSGA